MNKNNFMKAMSMIDEDILHEADIPEIVEKQGEFFIENSSEKAVSGVEIYRKNTWRRVLALASTMVIAVGCAAGGIYCFSRLKNDKSTVSDKGSELQSDVLIPEGSVVPDNEIKDFVEQSYYLSSISTALKYSKKDIEELEIVEELEINDADSIIEQLCKLSWVRTEEKSYDSDYYVLWGISITEDGFMSGTYNRKYVKYKLADTEMLPELAQIWENYLKPNNELRSAPFRTDGEDHIDLKEELQKISTEKTIQWEEGPMGQPQGKMCFDTITRFYTISDAKRIADGLSEFEWVNSSFAEIENAAGYREEGGFYISYGDYNIGISDVNTGNAKYTIYPEGYMIIDGVGCYRLKNNSDADKLVQLINDNIVMDESSVIAEKICKGITGYDNLDARYKYNYSYGIGEDAESYSVSGELTVDAKKEKMYMTGEGTRSYEIVMNGHDDSAFKVTDKETGKSEIIGTYHYSNGYTEEPPEYHYIYLCKDIEKALTPRYIRSYHDDLYTFDTRDVDGNTEITVRSSNTQYIILLTPKGQLISYEYTDGTIKKSFVLEDYVFDSQDFYMHDVQGVYDRIKVEEKTNISS